MTEKQPASAAVGTCADRTTANSSMIPAVPTQATAKIKVVELILKMHQKYSKRRYARSRGIPRPGGDGG